MLILFYIKLLWQCGIISINILKTNINHNQITVLSGCELDVQIIYLNESTDTIDSHRRGCEGKKKCVQDVPKFFTQHQNNMCQVDILPDIFPGLGSGSAWLV